MTKVFIDGSAGTTGLRIKERLQTRKDIELIVLSEELRKDENARRDAINSSDITFLCLPDDAAIQAVSMAENESTVIIDTSTAHRTNSEWIYGFPEIHKDKNIIKNAKRIANPGCHASGFISLIKPLRDCGMLDENAYLSCYSITGYSGGGKKMITQYESAPDTLLKAPRLYGLSQIHKHLPEMTKVCKLKNQPCFVPVVSDFYSGMLVTVTLFANQISGTVEDIKTCYKDYYTSGLVKYDENTDEDGFMSANALSGRDDMEISVFGNGDRIVLASRFDNLGKGASGSAIQNMNTVLGIDEKTGLITTAEEIQ